MQSLSTFNLRIFKYFFALFTSLSINDNRRTTWCLIFEYSMIHCANKWHYLVTNSIVNGTFNKDNWIDAGYVVGYINEATLGSITSAGKMGILHPQ